MQFNKRFQKHESNYAFRYSSQTDIYYLFRSYSIKTIRSWQRISFGEYIYYLNTYGHFPDFDPREVYQFFHPPLHHSIEALWLSVVGIFTDNQATAVEWLQVPTLIYSCIILLAVYGIAKEMKLTDKASAIVMTIVAFHPSLIFMAGSLNNDGLSFMFQFLIIYTVIKWYNDRKILNIVFIALSIGLGMISKLSAGMLAIPVAFVFIYVFVRQWKEEKAFPAKIFIQYLIFAVICIPIGLSWALRCFIRFNMPLNYVNHLPVDSWQYVGDYSYMERFFLPNPVTLLSNLKNGSIGLGENMWVQLFRTAALGECDLSEFPLVSKIIMMLMILAAFIIALWAFIDFVKVFILGRKSPITIFLIITYAVLVVFFINFCINYPHQCTMNFRYIVPTVLIPALAMGINADSSNSKAVNTIRSAALIGYSIISFLTILCWCIAA